MRVITIPNLDRYQHYKERKPVWIKLYIDIFDDDKFVQLTSTEKWIYIGILMLAVKNSNILPISKQTNTKFSKFDSKLLRSRLQVGQKRLDNCLTKLRQLGLISILNISKSDIKKISKRYQADSQTRLDKIRLDKTPPFKNAKDIVKEKINE